MAGKKLNPEGNLLAFGSTVRVERGLTLNSDGHAEVVRDPKGNVTFTPEPVWKVYRKVDTKEDPDTTDEYRFDEVAAYTEEEPGVCPDKAIARAEALAKED